MNLASTHIKSDLINEVDQQHRTEQSSKYNPRRMRDSRRNRAIIERRAALLRPGHNCAGENGRNHSKIREYTTRYVLRP